jgi:hypothetical protein
MKRSLTTPLTAVLLLVATTFLLAHLRPSTPAPSASETSHTVPSVTPTGFASSTAWAATSATPPVAWTPASLTDQVATGQTKKVTVTFTSSEAASNVTVRVVPALSPFVQVSPSLLPDVQAGQSVPLTLALSAAGAAPLGTFDGTIQLRDSGGGVLAKPFPVTLTICRCITAKSVSITYPAGWQLHSTVLDLGGPIALNNFGNAYGEGGITPRGGATINITTIPLPPGNLSDFITKEVGDGTLESTTQITVGGAAATEVVFVDTYTPTVSQKTVAVYVPHGTLLYKVYLSYQAGDSSESSFLSALQQVLSSFTFT